MKVKQLLSLLSFLLLTNFAAFAQTGKISGRVTDTDGEPLPGVNVVIVNSFQGISADVDGYYQILNVKPGTYTIQATIIGFSTVTVENVVVSIGLTTKLDIKMAEQTIEGEEIVVYAEQPVVKKDVSSSQANISKENIEALPVTSVTSVVGLQAGVEGLSIRGSGSDEIAFNLNGFSLRSGRDNSPFTGISVTSIENVQVQTGGFNAEYGNIRSGLINVTSKEGDAYKYSFDGLIRLTPAQAKNSGQDVNSPDSYWLRPYMDDDVAWTGTSNGAWDNYTQSQYPIFEGWNEYSQATLADSDPTNDLTPEAAQQAFLWQHRKDMAITEPDYEIDLTLGGPVPGISEKLGNLRFSTSFRRTQNMYFIPLANDKYEQTTFQGKLTSNVAPGMKLSFDGMYSKEIGTSLSRSGGTSFFDSASDQAYYMERVSYIESRIYSTDYWSPSEQVNSNIGVQFTHTLSNTTFYEVKMNNFYTGNSTNPGAYRDTSGVISIGGVEFDEAPFGFFDESASGIGSDMRMGVGMSTSRDSSKTSAFTTSIALTSQLDRVNEFKTGLEFVRTNSRVNYGTYDKALPDSRSSSKWNTKPIRLALFVQDKLEFNGMIANIGLRLTYSDPNIEWYDYDDYSLLFSDGYASSLDTMATYNVKPQVVLQPRLGVSFPITEKSKLFFNYGHFVQLPDPENLYLVRVEPFTDTIVRMASPENPLPKTVAYELGYEQSILDEYLIRVTGYYKDLTNQPLQVDYISRDNYSYSVSEPYWYEDIRGLEFTLKKEKGEIFWGEFNYTFSANSYGFFGTLENYENSYDQRVYDRNTTDNDIAKPVARPYARVQLVFKSPSDFGPEMMGSFPLANWQLSNIVSWKAGQHITWTGSSTLPGITYNLQARDYWGTTLRLNRKINMGGGNSMDFFMDMSNVINRKSLSLSSGGFIDGTDYQNYMSSLHLPMDKLEEIGFENSMVPGSDKPGDYRAADVEWVPIETATDLAQISSPNTRALYYNTLEGAYYQYSDETGGFVEADQGYVDKVLDEKAYIDMPNQSYFNFLDPRTIRFGIRFSF